MESMLLFNELEVHEDSINHHHFFLCVLINPPPHSNGGGDSQMKGNFQHFTGKKNLPSAACQFDTLLEKDKNTLRCLYVEHLLQLIGNVIRQCSHGLMLVTITTKLNPAQHIQVKV